MLLLELFFDFLLFIAYMGIIAIIYTLLNAASWLIFKKPLIKMVDDILFKNF